jgi:tyrosyl-tRNA synthetase
MFGKLMSISDELMARYYTLLLGEDLPAIHPMEAKKQLAFRIVERYHTTCGARAALDDFNTRFSKRDLASADLPSVSLQGVAPDIISLVVAAYAIGFKTTRSRSEVRRLVEQGSIHLGEDKVTDPKTTPSLTPGTVLRLDKTRAVRIGAA